jgi:hypothetical protein
MTISQEIKQNRATISAEQTEAAFIRVANDFTRYRAILATSPRTREEVIELAALIDRLKLTTAEADVDKSALDKVKELRTNAANAMARLPQVSTRLGGAQVRWLMLRESSERVAAATEIAKIQAEQSEIFRVVKEAVAKVNGTRQTHERVKPAIEEMNDELPQNVLAADPLLCALLCALLATELVSETNPKVQAQYLRMRGVPMHSSMAGWSDPSGVLPLYAAFKNQIARDRSILPATRTLLDGFSSFHR